MNGWNHFNKKYICRWLLLLACLALTTSCTSRHPEVHRLDRETEPICSVAVLPFINDSKFDQGDIIVQRIMVAGLTSFSGLKIAGEGDVRLLYPELRIFPGDQPTIEQIQIIGSRLGVQAIIAGRIIQMTEKSQGNEVNPAIEIHLQVFDAKSGQTLWKTFHWRDGHNFRKIMHFGLINTVSKLAEIMTEEIYKEWQKEGFAQCETK